MEHNPLDESIKRIIENNIDHQTAFEENSREVVWNQLEINRRKGTFPLLRIAAAIVLLLPGGFTIYQTSQFQRQKIQYSALENKYQEIERNLLTLKTKESFGDSLTRMESQIKTIIDTVRITELQYVVQYDTIYLTNDSNRETIFVHQIDTLYLPSPETMPSMQLAQSDSSTTDNRRPSSVEFLFNQTVQNNVVKKKDRGPVLILNGNAISQDKE